MEIESSGSRKWVIIISGIFILVGLYLTTLHSYLLFHSIAEVFIIVVACGIFILAWNSRRFLDNNYLLFIGVAYLFIAILELIHTLGYAGMGIFKGYGADLPTQLWIAARYMESFSLFLAPLFFGRRLKLNILFIVYSSVTCLIFLSVFLWNIFPVCFVEGTGLTPFKKISEYVICIIYIGSIALLYLKQKEFENDVYRLLIAAIIISMAAELAFTFYINVYGFSNLVGHYFKIISFFFVYKAIVETGLIKPHTLLYRRLKKSEEKYRLSETRYRELFDNISSGVAIYEVRDNGNDFIFKDLNKAGERLDGNQKESLIGKSIYEVRSSIKEFGLLDVFRRVFKTGVSEHFPAKEYKDDRLQKWYENFVYRLPSEEIVAVFDDITDRMQVEETLRESYTIINRSPAVVFLWKNAEGWPVQFVSDNIKELLGYTAEELASGKISYTKMLHPDDLERVAQEVVKNSEKGIENFVHKPYRIFTKDGETKWVDDRTFIRRNEKGDITHYQGIVLDITERKRLEEELLRAEKLESVGLLAGGIAHDFNNILTTILGNVSLGKMQMTPDGETFEMLSEAEKASIRAQTLTKQLLTFAKGGAPIKETASIKDILKESPSFVLRGSKSRCELSIAEDLWPAEVDVGQISQAINNIVINANQAMPEGGTIRVEAENLTIDDGHGLPLKPGRYIRISIKDQGVGIAEKHLANIFDPYFTTKHDGSGLGLATAHSIIEKHEGHITVESLIGVGTTLHIYLPASDKMIPEKEEVQLIKGQGRILVMDDEASLRKMLGRMLKNLGYESKFAKDGAEAIEMYKAAKKSEKPYDAVIMDLTIPGGMGGKEAINKLLEIDPEVKAIVSSGYSDDPVLANFREYGFKGMIPKPFEFQSLSKVLHEAIKGKG